MVDAIPCLLAWLSWTQPKRQQQPFIARIEGVGRSSSEARISLTWNMSELRQRSPDIEQRIRRLSTGRTVDRERVTENAGYALAFVALSCIPPARRVVDLQKGVAPDLLPDATPGAFRGVEVAARLTGGMSALRKVRRSKADDLLRQPGLAEVHLSLWSGSPRAALLEQLR